MSAVRTLAACESFSHVDDSLIPSFVQAFEIDAVNYRRIIAVLLRRVASGSQMPVSIQDVSVPRGESKVAKSEQSKLRQNGGEHSVGVLVAWSHGCLQFCLRTRVQRYIRGGGARATKNPQSVCDQGCLYDKGNKGEAFAHSMHLSRMLQEVPVILCCHVSMLLQELYKPIRLPWRAVSCLTRTIQIIWLGVLAKGHLRQAETRI